MRVNIIPCLSDNYAYFIEFPNSENSTQSHQTGILIDAPEFDAIDNFIERHNFPLNFILSTHHHWDHVGGNVQLKEKYGCKIFGSDQTRIPGIDHKLTADEAFKIAGCSIQAIRVPGHTSNHTIYFFTEDLVLFSGDTLFSMGCGKLFEGTYEEMYNSLQKIKALPDHTQIYCGHEYSKKNGLFALSVDPENNVLKNHYQDVLKLRANNMPTVPTPLSLEKEINPFLRASSVDEFSKLRDLRDAF